MNYSQSVTAHGGRTGFSLLVWFGVACPMGARWAAKCSRSATMAVGSGGNLVGFIAHAIGPQGISRPPGDQ